MVSRLEELTAAELGKEVGEGRLDPEEVLEYFIERITRLNPKVNAFTYTKFDEARLEAEKLKQRIKNGEKVGPFAGVPFGLKDFLPSKKGWPASHGGVPSRQTIDDVDSEFCKAMEKAGGIAVGKTNAPAYGFSGTCDNKLYGATHNPFNLDYNSGGSSGGSAAAVASGMLLISEGGDAGGSIRIPASWNNLFGFKASAGAIPSVIRPDSYAATHPFCCNGGLTKSVQDAAILMNFMVRYDPRDPTSVPYPNIDFCEEMKKPVKGLRVAYTPGFDIFPVDKEVQNKVRAAVERLKELGIEVEDVSFNLKRTAEELIDMWCYSLSFDSAIEFDLMKKEGVDFLKEHGDEVSEVFTQYVKRVDGVGKKELYEFNLIRTELLDAFEDVFEDYDFILSPTSLCLPVKNGAVKGSTIGPSSINETSIDPTIGFASTFLANFNGYPAASVPIGLSEDGLPIGLHIMAPKFHDGKIFALAKAIEDHMPWKDNFKNLTISIKNFAKR